MKMMKKFTMTLIISKSLRYSIIVSSFYYRFSNWPTSNSRLVGGMFGSIPKQKMHQFYSWLYKSKFPQILRNHSKGNI